MITEDYVSFEVSKLLKEKGFGEPDIRYGYNKDGYWEIIEPFYPRVTHQMAMKWLREIHKINIDIKSRWKLNPYKLDYYYFVLHYKNVPSDSFIIKFDSYEEAVEAALKYCLENLV
jgi:hypothetical protein